jgi:hypothetical protein
MLKRAASEQDEIVPVDHLLVVDVAQDRLELDARAALDPNRVLGVVVDQSAGDFPAPRSTQATTSPRAKWP